MYTKTIRLSYEKPCLLRLSLGSTNLICSSVQNAVEGGLESFTETVDYQW